ncbi:MAG: hypothetical protein JO257_29985 [Deltaproteobacteria bacterium]|nr:hypothetical protein [Deltaproteobacteria bacterium]
MMKKLVLLSLVVSSVAFAGDPPKGGAAGAPAPGPADAKKMMAPPPGGDAKPPGPPQEIADMAKGMSGTWKCVGKADVMGTMQDIKGTVTHKSDLDGWWINTTINGTMAKGSMKNQMFTTYDAAAKKWYRVSANSHGGHAVSWGTAAGTKVSWEGDAHWGGKDLKIRGSEEMVSPKEAHIVGEMSDDGGKTWKPDHDVTCKK